MIYILKLKYLSPWLVMSIFVKGITFHDCFLIRPWWNCLPIYKQINSRFLILSLDLSQQKFGTHFISYSSSLAFLFYIIASKLFFVHKDILLLLCSLIFVYVVVMFHMIFTWFSSYSRVYGFFYVVVVCYFEKGFVFLFRFQILLSYFRSFSQHE